MEEECAGEGEDSITEFGRNVVVCEVEEAGVAAGVGEGGCG